MILRRDPGIADLVTDRESGWIAGSDTSDIVPALLILKEDRSLRERVALAGRKVASSRTWDDVVSETVLVYRKDGR